MIDPGFPSWAEVAGLGAANRGFWQAVAAHDGRGAALFVRLTTWKRECDKYGHLCSDLIHGVVGAIWRYPGTSNAAAATQLAATLYGEYWTDGETQTPAERAHSSAAGLDKKLPLRLQTAEGWDISIEAAAIVIERGAGDSGEVFYRRVMADPEVRDAHFDVSWEQLMLPVES